MFELEGAHTKCKVFSDDFDESAVSQIYNFLNHTAFKGTTPRFMPDYHAGKGAVIGTTVQITDKVIPNVVGVDISCGVLSYNLGKIDIDFPSLDTFIRNNIPYGKSVNSKIMFQNEFLSSEIDRVCAEIGEKNVDRHKYSVGSLGGGNHFLEVGVDESGNKWLTVHSGSRNFGLKIATFHQNKAKSRKANTLDLSSVDPKLREKFMEAYRKSQPKVPKGMEYLEGSDVEQYLVHCNVAKRFSSESRTVMLNRIVDFLGCSVFDKIECVHNYIDIEERMLRKGAISAKKGEKVIIPWNMRDGLIIGEGLGNLDWNNSAPHGAGRISSRSEAKKSISLEEFEKSMEGIYTSCVSEGTKDEAPMAYKDFRKIEEALKDSVKILKRVKPIYNFKA